MAYQAIFKRYELKYMLTRSQKEAILKAMEPYMALDKYGRTTIRNLYFDTENYRLIRHSIEKPVYKEKLRLRSYRLAEPDSPVFVELKKKFKSVVYKRRLSMPEEEAMHWLCDELPKDISADAFLECFLSSDGSDNQIAQEIRYFKEYYKTLHPTVFLSYEREAYYCRSGGDFRVTFDDHILYRQDNLSLESEISGTPLLDDDKVLMEIKTSGGIPLWMTHALSENHIYKTSFSKYGTAYKEILTNHKGEYLHA
ncbi:MAG: polyphosphate polymerase domain-containing protein [Ruminococcus sp.]|nr:polyphosphate polymerase domain-containing protein [Ruminococcus sp.]